MTEIIIIGTIHLNSTPKAELEEALSNLNPDQVLVELSPEELLRSREESIRDEMFAAYDWAIQNNVRVAVFDVEDDVLKDGVTGSEPEFMESELKGKEILKNYTWKELNRIEPWQDPEIMTLEEEIVRKYFDTKKSEKRDQMMLENLKKQLIEGRNVIVTGTGHLTFFKKEMPEAKLPFRD
jgi:pheromone shutdown protein TraB